MELLEHRAVFRLEGSDREKFLQGIISNDIVNQNSCYALILSPQGKILFDMFLLKHDDNIIIECHKDYKENLIQKLKMYKLRADVEIIDDMQDYYVYFDNNSQELGLEDTRFKDKYYRIYTKENLPQTQNIAYLDLRIENIIPEFGLDIEPNKCFAMEYNMDRLNAISFKKGCFIGQEVTARMKNNLLNTKRSLYNIKLHENAKLSMFDEIKDLNASIIGMILSHNQNSAIAIIKIDAVENKKHLELDKHLVLK